MASSPDRAFVYLETIAPIDQTAAARTDVSYTPLRNAYRACGDSGTTRGLPVFDVRTTRKLSERFTTAICSRSISLRRRSVDHRTSIRATLRNVLAAAAVERVRTASHTVHRDNDFFIESRRERGLR